MFFEYLRESTAFWDAVQSVAEKAVEALPKYIEGIRGVTPEARPPWRLNKIAAPSLKQDFIRSQAQGFISTVLIEMLKVAYTKDSSLLSGPYEKEIESLRQGIAMMGSKYFWMYDDDEASVGRAEGDVQKYFEAYPEKIALLAEKAVLSAIGATSKKVAAISKQVVVEEVNQGDGSDEMYIRYLRNTIQRYGSTLNRRALEDYYEEEQNLDALVHS